MNLQPFLIGASLTLRPLAEEDFDELYLAAADPLIWEQHPDRHRYEPGPFEIYFRSGMDSKGALAIVRDKKIIGSSRYTHYNSSHSSVEIGYSFLTREHWGQKFNLELKTLMLNHAFRSVESAFFVVGISNFRSQKAMQKIGGIRIFDISHTPVNTSTQTSVVFEIKKSNWKLF